jgi:hypothetical protein
VSTGATRLRSNYLHRRERAGRRGRLWFCCGVGGLAVGLLGWFALALHRQRHATIVFTRESGAVPRLELTFFPDRLAFAAPSPPKPLGRLTIDGGTITVGSDLVPEHGLVRYRGVGVAAGFVFVRLGDEQPRVQLRAARSLSGRVGSPIGYWCWSWPCAGHLPVEGAEVILMGGGEHGVELVSTRSDRDGRFTLEGIDGELDGLGLRVRARGHEIFHEALGRVGETRVLRPVLALTPATNRAGKLVAPREVDVTNLCVLARGFVGVQAQVAQDGAFVLDHVPFGAEPKLIVYGLTPDWAQTSSGVTVDGLTTIEVVRAALAKGRVVDAATGDALPDALVFCEDQEAVRADARGRYALGRLLAGDVELRAQWQVVDKRRRATKFFGRRRVTLVAGEVREVDIPVTTR